MRNFRKLLFWETFSIVVSLVVWGFAPNDIVSVAAAAVVVVAVVAFAFAVAFVATFIAVFVAAAAAVVIAATTVTAVATVVAAVTAVALIAVLALAPELRLRFLPVAMSIAVEFTAIFLLFNYGWPLAAALGILILFGMGYLPEKLIVRSAVTDN